MSGIEREKIGPLPIWGWGVCGGVLLWALYVWTLAPTTGFWDTSEYIATAHILGLPHPPGNPFFVLFGRVWTLSLAWTGLGVAARINLLSATFSAAASVFWFLAVARIWAHFTSDRRQVLVASLIAMLVGGTAFTVWSQSNLNEKVYTVSLLVIALVSYLAMLWEDEAGTWRGDRLILLVAFLVGLGASNHTISVLALPALGLLVLWHDWRTLLRWKLAGAAALFLLVGFSVQLLFVPIRSAENPIIDEADPQCESLIEAVIPDTYVDRDGNRKLGVRCEALSFALNRDQYRKPPLSERQAPLSAQYANYWQYFDWQWGRGLGDKIRPFLTTLFLFFSFIGLWRHWKGDRDSFVYFGALLFTLSIALVFYLNFRYGYSLFTEEIPDVNQHEVRERDYFYIMGFQVWGLYAGLGIVTLWNELAQRLSGGGGNGGAKGGRNVETNGGHLRASPFLAVALIPLVLNFGRADRRGDYAARDWAYNLLQSVEPYGVLFTNGDNDTFPLWYLQEVEGIRRDVTVIVHSYLGTEWYPRQLRALTEPCPEGVDPMATPTVVVCQRPFDVEAAVGPYRGMRPSPPTRSIISLTDEEVGRLPPIIPIQQDTSLRVSEWVTSDLRQGDFLTYADLLVLHVIQQSMGDRPVYFAATAPPVYSAWRFQPHLLRQGLAHKLVHGPLESTADTVFLGDVADIVWIDRERTNALLWDVFQVDYLLDWDLWPEPSTRASIPAQYYLAYATLGMAEELLENPTAAERSFLWAEEMLELTRPPE